MRYLLITYVRKPNGQIDELVTISKRIKQSDIQSCNVIMDYSKRKVDKCVIEGKTHETTWDKMNEYYVKVYPNLISQLENSNTEALREKK